MPNRWIDNLNPAQRTAATHGDGPLLIIAGAGTGKTMTLACRVAHLLERGVAPDRILLLTFTRRAAAEMLRRAAEMTGADHAARVWGGTFHAVANRLLRIYAPAVGLTADFTVCDQADAADLMQLIRAELPLAKNNRRFPRKQTLAAIYSRAVAVQVERARRFYEPIFARAYDNAPMRLRDLEQLEHLAAGYRSRRRFLADLTLHPPTATSDLAQPPFLEEDYLVLSTIHSAKGCEWDAVHVLHAADGMIPSDMAVGDQDGIDEERRLLYVAMTRAKDWLYVYFPLRYYHRKHALGDAHSFAQLSRFLTPEVRAHFHEESTAHLDDDPASAGPRRNAPNRTPPSVDQYLRALWT